LGLFSSLFTIHFSRAFKPHRMNAVNRALKKGNPSNLATVVKQEANGTGDPSPVVQDPMSPKRKQRRATAMETADPTPVAKEHLSVREGGDIDLGILDQEAFARVVASGQQQSEPPIDRDKSLGEEEDEGPEVVDDVTYRPSGVVGEGADPTWALRMACLPVLDVFSTELLRILSSHQHSTILEIVTGAHDSPISHNYVALLQLFDATKKQLYSQEPYQAFLDPDLLGFADIQERKVIRKVNLATFISSVYGSVDVGFFHLNEGFVTTMAPDGGRLLKDMARLYLDLKTQAYISAMGQPSRDQNSILNDLFPSTQQLTHLLVYRRQPMTSTPATVEDLTPAEEEFVIKCERRRELLRSIGDSDEKVLELKEKYSWETFLRELRAYIAKNWEIIVGSRGGSKPRRSTKKRTLASTSALASGFDTAAGFVAPGQQGIATAMSANQTGPIYEAYEKARMMSHPVASPPATSGIPTPQPALGKSPQTPRQPGDANQVRRPWTKEEGTPPPPFFPGHMLTTFRNRPLCRTRIGSRSKLGSNPPTLWTRRLSL
jgi:hypothetical protein